MPKQIRLFFCTGELVSLDMPGTYASPLTFHPLRNHHFSPRLSSSLSAIALTFTKRVLKGFNRASSCLFLGCCGNTASKWRSTWSIIFSLFPHAHSLTLVSLSASQFFSNALARPRHFTVRYSMCEQTHSMFSLSLFLSRNHDWTNMKFINSWCPCGLCHSCCAVKMLEDVIAQLFLLNSSGDMMEFSIVFHLSIKSVLDVFP